MQVLLIGSGAREHALALAINRSKLLNRLFVAPGNPGIAQIADCIPIDITNHFEVIQYCHNNNIDLVVVGPEAPLAAGIVDDLRSAGINAFGPTMHAARLETSKGFTKELCRAYNIPTAPYEIFYDLKAAIEYTKNHPLPIVVKADGLAAGKGVTVARSRSEALIAIHECFENLKMNSIVIEQFLDGTEVSFFALCDGKTAIPFASARDYKRLQNGDLGPNTGGMGAYSPVPYMTDDMVDTVMGRIILPTVNAMARLHAPFTGVLFAGLMITDNEPHLIEYNVRFGDPETQVIMARLESDILPLLLGVSQGNIENLSISLSPDSAMTLVIAATGYPESPQQGGVIDLESVSSNVTVLHSGTSVIGNELVATGGRVLNVVAKSHDLQTARGLVYEGANAIKWQSKYYRSDIGAI